MMRRFKRSFRGGKRPKEPVSWDRREASAFNASAFGTPFALQVFDPTLFVSGNQDTRLTVRRLFLDIFPTFTFSAAVAQALVLGIGVELIDNGAASFHDPLMPAAADQRADWLFLAHVLTPISAGAGVYTASDTGFQGLPSKFSPIIRSMRKVDQDQVISVSINLKRLDAATFAAPTQTRSGVVIDSSVLFSRTMKR